MTQQSPSDANQHPLVQALVSYLPPAVVRAIQESSRPLNEPVSGRFRAAILFADISGFTALTEKLAAHGPHGAEELTLLLNRCFGRMIALLAEQGGEVVQFSGDALLAVFADGNLPQAPSLREVDLSTVVRRAWQAATHMQQAMSEFASLTTSVGEVALGIKIAIGAGEVVEFSVGGVSGRWQYIVAGDPLRQVAEAGHSIERGQTALSPEAQQSLLHSEPALSPRPTQPLRWPDAMPEMIAALRARVPEVITHRLMAGQADWLAELRRLSILFLGVGGLDYAADAALSQIQRWMEACQQTIYRYEGSLNKLFVDDKGTIGIALFGAPPLSHQDDPLRAVRCAFDLQQAAQEQGLRLAIGLTTGQVFAGPVGSPTRREYTVMGDAVNLAARLMQLAGRGGILGDHVTHQATQDTIEWAALTPQTVKGKAAAVHIYRPLGLLSVRRAPQEEQRLVGRAREMAQIEHAFKQSIAGQRQVLCLEGEPGIGKSRLVAELAQRVRERGLVGLFGSGDALEQQTPYNAWRHIFRSYLNLDGIRDREAQRQTVLARLSEIAPDLMERAPLLNDLLGLRLPETGLTASLDPRLRQASLSALLVDLLALWANERPLVLVLEDAHWLDSLSWQLVLQVARSLPDLPVLLVLALRPLENLAPSHPYARLCGLPQSQQLTLPPLDPSDIIALAAARLGVDDLPMEVARLFEQQAGGNPFVAEELALSLRDNGTIRIVDGECVLDGYLSDLQVPETLHGLVLSSIDRLPPEEQLTLKVASVIGRTFGYATLRDVYRPQLEEPLLQASLGRLAGRELVRQLETPTLVRSHAFKQAITQEVTYGTLLQSQSRELHDRVARWYEEHLGDDQVGLHPLLAFHWRQAQNAERELYHAVLASKGLAADYANNEALAFLDRALQLASDPATQHELLWVRLEVHDRIADRRAQQADLTQLQALADAGADPGRQAQVAHAWADYYRNISDYPAAIDALQRAMAAARQAQDLTTEARSLTTWGRVLEHQGVYRDARGYFEQALALHRRIGDPRGEAANLSNLSNIHRYLGSKVSAREYALQALRIRQAIGDKANEATSLTNLGLLSLELGEIKAADEYLQQALQITRAIGDRAGEAFGLITMGHGYLVQGDYAAAQRYLQQGLRLCHMMGERRREANCLNALGVMWRDVGDDGDARRCFEQALAIQEEIGSHSFAAYTYLNLGLALLQQDRAAARECYQKALDRARTTGNRDAEAYAWSYRAALHEQEGDWAAADGAYQDALAIRTELHAAAPAIEDVAGLARVTMQQGRLDEARQHVGKCLAHLDAHGVEGIEFPMRVYLTCYDVLLAAGDRASARRVLENVHELLLRRAGAISDPALRDGMLRNVPVNRRVMAEWEAAGR